MFKLYMCVSVCVCISVVCCAQRVTQQPLGQNDAYALPDLARMLWGCATLGITPRQGLLNSFANKSMDRVSSLPHQLALESAWASAACGQTLGSKWVNQWAVAVQVRNVPLRPCTQSCRLSYV